MKISKKTAAKLATCRIDGMGSMPLDKFMEKNGIPFGSSLDEINLHLTGRCYTNISQFTVISVDNPLTIDEELILTKIAKVSKMDTWFNIDMYGRVRDLEGNVKSNSTAKTRRVLVAQLIDGMSENDWNSLTDKEKLLLTKALAKCLNY